MPSDRVHRPLIWRQPLLRPSRPLLRCAMHASIAETACQGPGIGSGIIAGAGYEINRDSVRRGGVVPVRGANSASDGGR